MSQMRLSTSVMARSRPLYKEEDDSNLTEYEKMKKLLFPQNLNGKEMTCTQKFMACCFPEFNWKTVTFWYGLTFLLINIGVFVYYMIYSLGDMENTHKLACVFINLKVGSITPYIRFDYQFYRTVTSMWVCDTIYSAILGFLCIWRYGFALEKKFPIWRIFMVVWVATCASIFSGDFAEWNSIRAEGSTMVITIMMMHPGVVYKEFRTNTCLVVMLGIICGV